MAANFQHITFADNLPVCRSMAYELAAARQPCFRLGAGIRKLGQRELFSGPEFLCLKKVQNEELKQVHLCSNNKKVSIVQIFCELFDNLRHSEGRGEIIPVRR